MTDLTTFSINNIPCPLIHVPAGKFTMGEKGNTVEIDFRQKFPDGFYIGQFPVTQDLWMEIMNGENPSCISACKASCRKNILEPRKGIFERA